MVLNVLLDEPHVQANHSPNRSGQFAGGTQIAIAALTAACDRKFNEANLIHIVVRLGLFAETFAIVSERSLHGREVNGEGGSVHTASCSRLGFCPRVRPSSTS